MEAHLSSLPSEEARLRSHPSVASTFVRVREQVASDAHGSPRVEGEGRPRTT
jgi:hypothetical protein